MIRYKKIIKLEVILLLIILITFFIYYYLFLKKTEEKNSAQLENQAKASALQKLEESKGPAAFTREEQIKIFEEVGAQPPGTRPLTAEEKSNLINTFTKPQ